MTAWARFGTMPGNLAVGALTLYLIAALYVGIFFKLVHDWFVLPDFAHGFLVPIFVAYLLRSKRAALQQARVAPSWNGLLLLLSGLTLLVLGVLGSELFLARVSFLLVAGGIVWLLAGTQVLREVRFPLLICLLGIPIPQVLFNQITVPLQLLASAAAGAVLPLFHVPVLRSGNVIQLPSIALEVAEACSGIRSLMSLCTLAVLYGYFAEKSTAGRWLLALASIPVAVCANAFRIVGTGILVQTRGPAVALGFFHEFSGLIVFVVSLTLLLAIHSVMSRLGGRQA